MKNKTHHFHFHAKKVGKLTDRTKHTATPTQESHKHYRGPYFQPGIGMGSYKYTLLISLLKFFKKVFRREAVKAPSTETVEKEHFDKLVMPKSSKTIRSTTRTHQRKGLK